MAAANLPVPSEKSKPRWKYDVFLSFRGKDTRKNFTDHLYSSLVRAGLRTFQDDQGLQRGENIPSGLLNAIRGSMISIVVFSKDYASSKWCLEELVEIVHCKNTRGHTLVPIFYDVNPSNVRKQTGTFAKAFARHERWLQVEKERVQRWRAALVEAADCSGWDRHGVSNGYESKFIDTIVEEVDRRVADDRDEVSEILDTIEDEISEYGDAIKDEVSECAAAIGDVFSDDDDDDHDVFNEVFGYFFN